MANPAPTINQINAFNATQGTTIDFNIIGGTDLVRSNIIYIYDLDDNSLICTHLYVSTESIHELPPNTDASMVYESGKSSADFVNGAQYYAQIQTFTDIAGTEGGSGLSVAKMFWCLVDPTLTITTIPSTISTTSYNVSATYDANTSVVSNIIQQYQFSLYSATGSLLQSSGVVVGSGEQQGTSTTYDISYNFTGLSVGSSYYVAVDVTTTQGMSVSAQSGTFTVSIDTPTLGEATVVNNACDGYISVTSNLSSEYGGSGSGEIVSFETDSENVFTKLQVTFNPTQSGTGTPSPSNVRPIYGVGGVEVDVVGKNLFDGTLLNGYYDADNGGVFVSSANWRATNKMRCKPSTTYVMSGTSYAGGSYNGRSFFWDENGNYLGARGTGANFTSYPNSAYMALYLGVSYVTDVIQIEEGTTATAYEPYQGQTVSQSFNVSLTPTSKDTDPYLFKAVGDIYGDRLEEELVGGTVAWNQLVVDGEFQDLTKWRGSNSTITAEDGGVKVEPTASFGGVANNGSSPLYVKGHKYMTLFLAKGANGGEAIGLNNSVGANVRLGQLSTTKQWFGHINASNSSGNYAMSIFTFTTSEVFYVYKVMVFDLTQMLGSTIADYVYSLEQATAGSGIAWLKSYGFFTKPYYEYDSGTLKSVNPTAHVTRGVNAWDEEWEVGRYDGYGNTVANTNCIRAKNFIPCLPNTTYYFMNGTHDGGRINYYDAEKQFIQSVTGFNATKTTPNNAYYMLFSTATEYGGTYKNDICINISDPTINGKYFPYEEHTYPLGDVVLRGIPKLDSANNLYYDGDTYESDGTVTRKYGIVDLGTLNYIYNPSYGFITQGLSSVIKNASGYTENGNLICSKYITYNYNDITAGTTDKCIGVSGGNYGYVVISDSSYTNAETFKTAMSGVYLVYELATPTTETADPFEQIQEVSKYGTLEYITTNDVPVGHNTTYMTRDVFGGTLDLVSGRLVVTHKMVDFPTTGWTNQDILTNTKIYSFEVADMLNATGYWGDIICDQYETIASSADTVHVVHRFNQVRAFVSKALHPTMSDWQTYLANLENVPKVWYPLAEPLTYQLTPQQINTLVGVNNVWSEQGNIELSYHIPITNLLVKRQDVDDVSGNWLTLYSQPITQASDMDFTFIDFLNQYGKTYKYALVPLLTQTQSGVEVEVEGGYTVSDEVQSIFDGVFISDSTGSQKCKANVGYGSVNMNQSVGSITPIGSQYPIIVTNSNNRYHNGSISGMIVPDDYYYNGNLSRIDMVNKRNELEQFLTNKRAKIIKDWNSNIWLVMIMDNIDCSFDNNYGMGIVTFNANWLEVGDPTNQEDLQATGLVDVGGV